MNWLIEYFLYMLDFLGKALVGVVTILILAKYGITGNVLIFCEVVILIWVFIPGAKGLIKLFERENGKK